MKSVEEYNLNNSKSILTNNKYVVKIISLIFFIVSIS